MSTDVFVDASGRRRRVLVWLSAIVGVVLAGLLGLLAVGLATGGSVPLVGWTSDHGGQPGPEKAVIGPAPADPTGGRGTAVVPTPLAPGGPAVTARPTAAAVPATGNSATGETPPGRGAGRSNKPTAKPTHPSGKSS